MRGCWLRGLRLVAVVLSMPPSTLSTADDGVSTLSVLQEGDGLGSTEIEGLGYHLYGPATATIEADAVWVSGKYLCDGKYLAAGPSLAGMVVVSDGVLCHKIATDLYTELDERQIAAYVQVSATS